MRELQIELPAESSEKAEKIIENYADDLSKTEITKKNRNFVEFNTTVNSEQIDELTEQIKGIKEIKKGDLSIKILKQEGLIKKGVKTKGSSSGLSQEELYSKAQEFGEFTRAQWSLIILSSAIAAYGLVFNNIIVVIGAMMLAPLLSPFVAGSISLAVGDKTLMQKAFLSGAKATAVVVITAYTALLFIPASTNDLIQLIASPGIPTIILSLLVGSAAALTFASGLRDQIAGVAVAIALVPPLAAVGVGLNMQNLEIVVSAIAISTINMLSVVLAGFATFKLLGISPSTYYKKKSAEDMKVIIGLSAILMLLLGLGIGYFSIESYNNYVFENNLQEEATEVYGEQLLEIRTIETGNHQVIVMGESDLENIEEYDYLSADNVEIIGLMKH